MTFSRVNIRLFGESYRVTTSIWFKRPLKHSAHRISNQTEIVCIKFDWKSFWRKAWHSLCWKSYLNCVIILMLDEIPIKVGYWRKIFGYCLWSHILGFISELLLCSIEAAYAAFSQARPPGIIKGHYIEELYSRYGSQEDAPPPPPLPAWYTESDDGLGMGLFVVYALGIMY